MRGRFAFYLYPIQAGVIPARRMPGARGFRIVAEICDPSIELRPLKSKIEKAYFLTRSTGSVPSSRVAATPAAP